METQEILLLSFSSAVLLAAVLVFLRQINFGEYIANCCRCICATESHQESHLDKYNLRIHYKPNTIIIEGLHSGDKVYNENAHCNPISNYETGASVDYSNNRDIVLAPLPQNLRSQCPSASPNAA